MIGIETGSPGTTVTSDNDSNTNAQDLRDIVANKLAAIKVNQKKKDATRAASTAKKTGKPASDSTSTSTPTSNSSNDDFTNQLEQLLGSVSNTTKITLPSQKSLSDAAKKASEEEYKPQIAAIKKTIGTAQKRGGKAAKTVADIYDQLINYYGTEKKATGKAYAGYKSDAAARKNSQKSEITKDYTQRLKEQTDMYKQLGIEAAAPSALGGQFSDEAAQLSQADVNAGTEQSALGTEQAAANDYLNAGQTSSKSEAAGQLTNMKNTLEDYVNKQNANIAGLQGQENSMYTQSLAKLNANAAASAATAQEAANKQQSDVWSRMMQLANLKRGLASDQSNQALAVADLQRKIAAAQASSTSAAPNYTQGLLGASQYLGDQNQVNDFQSSLDAATQWKGTPQAQQYFGGKIPSSPEEMATIIRWNAANKGMTPEEQNKLYRAALIYYGKGGGK